jgi:hypothetical protein
VPKESQEIGRLGNASQPSNLYSRDGLRRDKYARNVNRNVNHMNNACGGSGCSREVGADHYPGVKPR